MTIDWTISIGNVLTTIGALFVLGGMILRIARSFDHRITTLEVSTEIRHEENKRRFEDIARLVKANR